MLEHKLGEVVFEDISDKITQIACRVPDHRKYL